MIDEGKHVVIVGGGFAGISTALALEKHAPPKTKITLVTAESHFEYSPALYRLVTGASPSEVCIPLQEIFLGKNVDVIKDRIIGVRRDEGVVVGASQSRYRYDYLVLALGSETNYFGIPGLKEYSYGMKSMSEAFRLKQHVNEVLLTCKTDFGNTSAQVCDANFVVVGAGATGVEMAGQLAVYAKNLAREHGMDPSLVSVELIEGASKILPALPAEFTERIEHHLRGLGVNIFLNRMIEREEAEEILLKDMNMKVRTVIWTAGAKANSAYGEWGLPINKQGKVDVDKQLRLPTDPHVYIAGDGAATKYSGWAQTAMYDGKYIARAIASEMRGKAIPIYDPPRPVSAIPTGPKWAGVQWGRMHIYGRLGWWLRSAADLRSFIEILSFGKAWKVFKNGSSTCETCSVCFVETPHQHA